MYGSFGKEFPKMAHPRGKCMQTPCFNPVWQLHSGGRGRGLWSIDRHGCAEQALLVPQSWGGNIPRVPFVMERNVAATKSTL